MILLNTCTHYGENGATFSVRDGEISMKQRIYNEIERPPVSHFLIQPASCLLIWRENLHLRRALQTSEVVGLTIKCNSTKTTSLQKRCYKQKTNVRDQCRRLRKKMATLKLRYESSTLTLYKQLSSSIFQSL